MHYVEAIYLISLPYGTVLYPLTYPVFACWILCRTLFIHVYRRETQTLRMWQ